MTKEDTLAQLRELNHKLALDKSCSPSKHLSIINSRLGELDDSGLLAEIDIAVGKKYAEAGKAQLARQHLTQGQERYESLLETERDWWWIGFMHNGLALLYGSEANFEQSLHHSFLSNEASRESGYEYGYRTSKLNIGLTLMEMGLGDEATKYIKEVANSSADEPEIMGMAYKMLGVIYQATSDFEQAKKYYDMAISQPSSVKQNIITRCSLLPCCIALGNIEDAKQLISDARDLAATSELDANSQVTLLVAQAHLEILHQAYEEAKSACAEALTIAVEAGNPDLQNRVKLQQGRILLLEGQIEAGQALLESLLQARLWSETRIDVNNLLLEHYESTGQWKAAYMLFKEISETKLFAQSQLHSIEQLVDSRHHELALKKKNDDLFALQAEKDELFGVVVHDLNNPLSAALANVGLLISNASRYSAAEAQQRHKRIRYSLLLSVDIISQLTAMAEAESEHGEVAFETIAVDELVASVVAENITLANNKEQNLVAGELTPIQIQGNLVWVKQILSNLISNAIKYSLPGATTTVSLSVSPSEEQVYIEVKDEGLGFSRDDLLHVFTKYKKLSAMPTGNEPATGLGLYISKTLAEKMKGTISITSDGKNKGSSCVLALPR